MKQRDTIIRCSAACFLFLLTFTIYLPALQNSFVNWDDNIYVYENQNIRSIDLDFIRWSFSDASVGHWHPVTWISLALDYALWGLDPKGFHLTNIILHSLNTVLVFILAMRLIVEGSRVQGIKFEPSTPVISAAVAAVLFGIHPAHVESVAWATERKDVLSTFFFLITLLSYIKYTVSQKKIYYCTTLLLFTIAIMTKPMVVTLPIVLLILDFYPFQRLSWKGSKWVNIEKIPFFLLSLTSSLITMWAAGSGAALEDGDFAFITRLFISARGYIFYLAKMAVPVNLAPLYPYPAKVNILTFEYLGSAVLLVSITIYCLWTLKRGRLIFSVWMYYVITLLPVIGIIHAGQQDTADRYTYMPSIGPFLLTGLATGYVIERKRLFPVAAALLILSGVLIDKTIKQIRVWHDPITLWSHEIRLFPDAAVAHCSLGEAYSDLGNHQLALKELSRAIELDTGYAEAYNRRGNLYCEMGEYLQSISDLKKVVELAPKFRDAYYKLGFVYSRLGEGEKAMIYYQKAAALGLKK